MKNNAPEQFVGVDCEKLPEQLYQAHLDEFLRKNRECAELLENEAKKNGFATEIQNTDNFKGLLIRIFSDKITVTIRLMHRSSGHVKHRTDKNYMRIHVFSQSSFFVDKNGVPNQDIEQNHIPFENCEDARAVFKNLMNEIQKKHEKLGYR
jgi:hypothetical protein